MKLYHVTSQRAAEVIGAKGFRNGTLTGLIGTDETAYVSLLDVAADESEGARSSEACIEVDLPDEIAAKFEMVEEFLPADPGKAPPAGMNAWVTEWAIPADILNRYPRRLLTLEEHDAMPSGAQRQVRYRRLD